MKKILLALTAAAALSGSAFAADMPARSYSKAPASVMPVYSWTGFYIFGGGGGGLWNADSNVQSTGVVGALGTAGPAGTPLTRDQRLGGSGRFGTLGGGVENNLDIFGITAPGWFMKTEYRSSFYDRITLPETFGPGSGLTGPTGTAVTFKPWTQTISTSLVYRFNWGGPVVGKY